MDIIVKIKRAESLWPGYRKHRTRVTGYPAGIHSMSEEHWNARVKHVGSDRIGAALERGDIEITIPDDSEISVGGEE